MVNQKCNIARSQLPGGGSTSRALPGRQMPPHVKRTAQKRKVAEA